jgi:capsular exopolysaccharide synthesis family protein
MSQYELPSGMPSAGRLPPPPALNRLAAGALSAGPRNPAPPEVHIAYAGLLWRAKWWILAAMLSGAAAALGWVIWQQPLYEAATTVEILDLNQSFMGLDRVDPQAGSNNYGATAANIQTQTRIITSASLRSRAAERMSLEATPLPPPTGDLFSKLRNRLGLTKQEPVERMREAIRIAAASVQARGVGASRLLEISTESTAPEVAAGFVNTLASEYMAQNLQLRSGSALRTMQWMEGQLEEAKSRLSQAQEKLRDFIRSSGRAFVSQQGTLDSNKLAQLQAELSAIQSDRVNKQARYEIARSSPPDSLPEILDDGRMRGLREKLTELRRERAHLLATLTPRHYRVVQVDEQIREVEGTLEREKANLVRAIQNDYEAALRREKMLKQEYDRQIGAVASQIDNASELAGLRREVEMAQQAHDTLLQQLHQAMIASALPTNNVRVIDPAQPFPEPVRPKPWRDVPLGALGGGVLAYGIAVLVERRRLKRFNEVFVAPGAIGEWLAVPELGVIPTMKSAPLKTHPLLGVFGARHRASSGADSEPATGLVLRRSSLSAYADSFRATLASVLGRHREGWRPVFVITSAAPREGKTTVSLNLAIATAETGRKVLLIDADLRWPRLHKMLGVERTPGISELLGGPGDLPGDLSPYLRSTSISGLSLLPAGELVEPGAGWFSDKLARLIERLRKQFDVVFIDTPPVLLFPGARLAGHHSDGALLVVRAGSTHRRQAAEAHRLFAMDGIPVLGTILNDWDPEATGDEYYRGYYGEYKRYYQQAPETRHAE